jgi:diacylglycerol kinase family enzyme
VASFAIIVNPISGGANARRAAERIAIATAARDPAGASPDIFVTERAGHARELTRTALARGARLVVAWGGDGTINEVASELAFGAVPLAIVAAGSGNGLARELRIDRRPAAAIADALRAAPRSIDVGELGGRLFVNIAGVGIDAYIASRFNHPDNRRRGLAGYAAIGGGALLEYRPSPYTVQAEGTALAVRRGVLLALANSPQYGNGARIAPAARVDDGRLDLVLVDERSRLRTLGALPRLFTGGIARVAGCSILQIQTATIASEQPMVFHVDGEPVQGGTELKARVHAGALRLAVK